MTVPNHKDLTARIADCFYDEVPAGTMLGIKRSISVSSAPGGRYPMAKGNVKLKDIDIRGQKVEVYVTSEGGFTAEVEPDNWVYDSVLSDLVKKVQDATRKTSKLSIEFWRWDDGKLKRGIILGLHASSRNIRVKLGDEKAEQEYPWNASPEKYLRLDEYECVTYSELCEEAERADNAKAVYERSHTFDAVKAIRAELALGQAAEEDGE